MRLRIDLWGVSSKRGAEANRGAADAGPVPVPSPKSRENNGLRPQRSSADRLRVVRSFVGVFLADRAVLHSNNLVREFGRSEEQSARRLAALLFLAGHTVGHERAGHSIRALPVDSLDQLVHARPPYRFLPLCCL